MLPVVAFALAAGCFVLALFVLIPRAISSFRRQTRIQLAMKDVQSPPRKHWLLAHGPEVASRLADGSGLDWLEEVARGSKLLRLTLAPFFNIIHCTHPDTAKVALGPDPKADLIYAPLSHWLGVSLLTGSGKKWARTRRLLTPAFHFDVLKPYVKVYSECAEELVGLWSEQPEGESFNAFPYISHLTLDVMLRCTCSFESHCQSSGSHSAYVSAVYELSDLLVERILFAPAYYDWVYALMPSGRRNKRAIKLVHKFSTDVIKTRRATLENKKKTGESVLLNGEGKQKKYMDFIDILLEAKDEDGVGLTDEEIRAEVDTFMFEGHDTTASGITWTLYNLAKFPEHQQKCRDEVDTLFDEKGEVEWEDIKQLTYLTFCIKESLRLFPPVPLTFRSLSEDREVDGKILLKGTWIGANAYIIHRLPEFWENPEEFDPLRFTPENCKGRHPQAFIPFSAGPRNCIGQHFALNEQKVVIAHILRNFELSMEDGEASNVKKDYYIILRPKNGLFLKLKRRSH